MFSVYFNCEEEDDEDEGIFVGATIHLLLLCAGIISTVKNIIILCDIIVLCAIIVLRRINHAEVFLCCVVNLVCMSPIQSN